MFHVLEAMEDFILEVVEGMLMLEAMDGVLSAYSSLLMERCKGARYGSLSRHLR